MKKEVAIFSVLMGLAMFGTWLFLRLLAGFPQTQTHPLETGYLLVAEFVTAAALAVAGYGILSHKNWAVPLTPVALGELIYCAIRFAGELSQAGNLGGLAFFSLVGISGLVFAGGLVIAASRQHSLS